MAVKPKPKPAASKQAKPSASVVLDGKAEKKHSVKFWTDAAGQPFNNLYVSRDALSKLGNPATLKVTIEPGE